MTQKIKTSFEIPKQIENLTDAEFLSFLYSERERIESLNSYQGWSMWAVIGVLITVVCATYGIVSAHIGEIDRLLTIKWLSYFLGTIFFAWNVVSYIMSLFVNRKRAKDYRRLKHLVDVAPITYLAMATICSVMLSEAFIVFNVVNGVELNVVSISWIILAVSHLLICSNVYFKQDALVWALKEDVWFAKTRVMLVVGLFVFVLFWIVWKESRKITLEPFVGKTEFELAVCVTAIIILVFVLLNIKLESRKASEIDVLIDNYLYKGMAKGDVYRLLRAYQMGYGILESCSQELSALEAYLNTFEKQEERLDEVRSSFVSGNVDVRNLMEQFNTLKKSLEYNDEWGFRVDALNDKVEEIYKNVPELRDDEEFANMLNIARKMLNKNKKMNGEIKVVMEEIQRFIDEHALELCVSDCCEV